MSEKIPFYLRLDKEIYENLRRLAFERKLSKAEICQRAITQALENGTI